MVSWFLVGPVLESGPPRSGSLRREMADPAPTLRHPFTGLKGVNVRNRSVCPSACPRRRTLPSLWGAGFPCESRLVFELQFRSRPLRGSVWKSRIRCRTAPPRWTDACADKQRFHFLFPPLVRSPRCEAPPSVSPRPDGGRTLVPSAFSRSFFDHHDHVGERAALLSLWAGCFRAWPWWRRASVCEQEAAGSLCACASLQTLAALTRHSINLLPNHLAQALHVHSGPEEINERIESAIDLRSGDKLRREHMEPFSLMFKDSSLEEKVAALGGSRLACCPPPPRACPQMRTNTNASASHE